MKRFYLLVIATIIAFPVFAQSEKGYVYLKNGTILKGKYQFTDDHSKLRVESAGNIWMFNASEIDSVTNSHVKREKGLQTRIAQNHLFVKTELGVLIGNSENSQGAPFSFHSSTNYPVTPKISAGIGLGVEFLKETYLPAFLNLEYKFRNTFSTPFILLKAGYEVPLEQENNVYNNVYPAWYDYRPFPNNSQENLKAKGGVLINPGLGYLRMFSSSFGMSFAFGYRFHRLHYKGEKDYALDIDYNRLSISIGIIFN
ncbi:MAG: hypothetical protein J7L95_07670 [Prolixibacteraceae bacterium]|nr:hypothetical protein [Prolixibacteraceae bacterium]